MSNLRNGSSILFLVGLFCGMSISRAVPAQTTPETLSLGGDTSLTLSVEERSRWEFRDNMDFDDSKDDTNSFLGNRLRLGLQLDIGKEFTLFAQGQDTRQWGSDAVGTTISGRYDDLRQAFFRLQNVGGVEGLVLKAGRQELSYGDQRLVGAFGWSNMGRTFDALKVRYVRPSYSLDAFLARGRRRPLLGDHPSQTLAGLYARLFQNNRVVDLDLYYLLKSDSTRIPGELASGLPRTTRIPTAGARLLLRPAEGWQAVYEGAFQRGHKGPDDHRSHAQALRVQYTFPADSKPFLGVEVDRAKGDRNPVDGVNGSFDNLFPTNHGKYGFMDYQNWSNTRVFALYGGLKPSETFSVRVAALSFRLDSANAPWTSAGGAVLGWDPAGRMGRSVGKELDLFAQGSHIWGTHLSWFAGYSVYFPGEYAKALRGDDESRFAYVQVRLAY